MGCGASAPVGPPPPPPRVPTAPLAAWSEGDVAGWFATLPKVLQPYAPLLVDGADGALLADWSHELLSAAGVDNAYHRAQLIRSRDRVINGGGGGDTPADGLSPAASLSAPAAAAVAVAERPAAAAPPAAAPAAAPPPPPPAKAAGKIDAKARAAAAAWLCACIPASL